MMPPTVANSGFDAMMQGEGDVVTGLKNKVQSAVGQCDAGRSSGRASIARWRNQAQPGSKRQIEDVDHIDCG